jgi:hypothetical protein
MTKLFAIFKDLMTRGLAGRDLIVGLFDGASLGPENLTTLSRLSDQQLWDIGYERRASRHMSGARIEEWRDWAGRHQHAATAPLGALDARVEGPWTTSVS